MAKTINSEELQLKKRARRRLVGAIALVLVVVVFLPMILDNEPRPVSQEVAIHIPPPGGNAAIENDADTTQSEPLRFRSIEPADSGPDVATAENSGTEPDSPEREEQTTVQPRVFEVKPPAAPEPASSTKPQPANTTFVVQLGAFSDAANAARLAAKIRESKFAAYTEIVSTSSGKRTRVRVGPFASRAEAERARDRLKVRKLTLGEPAIMRSDS